MADIDINGLPQAPPFRFLHRVKGIDPHEGLEGLFDPSSVPVAFRGASHVPEACVLEALAQAAILYFVHVSRPLRPGETPLLGHLSARLCRSLAWDDFLNVRVRPLRVLSDRAIFDGQAQAREGLVTSARMTVAKRQAD